MAGRGAAGLTLEITDGITEHANRVALKGVFSAFGDVLACWVPPIDRRGVDNASVRFAASAAAEAAKTACDAGQVFFQGLPLVVKWRAGGGPRVGNSDIGGTVGGNSPTRPRNDNRSLRDRSRSRDKRRSRSRGGGARDRRRSRSRDRDRDRSRRSRSPRDRRRSPSRENRFADTGGRSPEPPEHPALPPPLTMPQLQTSLRPPLSVDTPWGTFSGGGTPIVGATPFQVVPDGISSVPPVDVETELRRKKQAAAARSAQLKRGPGVAALVQGALKRAQTAEVKKKADQAEDGGAPGRREDSAERDREGGGGGGGRATAGAAEEREDKKERTRGRENAKEKDKDKDRERRKDEKARAARAAAAAAEAAEAREREEERRRAAATPEKLREEVEEEKRLAELKEKEKRDKEEKDALEFEREKARRAAAEADEEAALDAAERGKREQRVRAGVEAAKKQQAEREKREANKLAPTKDTLYSDMPDPNLEINEVREAERRQAAGAKQQRDLALPDEDRSKVVFLDVDGVLRPARAGSFDLLSVDGAQSAQPDTSDFFPSAMRALRHIIERTGAVIVLSSEWRRSEVMRDAVDDVLEANRLRPCHSLTRADLEREPANQADPLRSFADRRAREITAWLREHEDDVKGWVVLDDINLAIADENAKPGAKCMGPKLVQTWPLCGLTTGNAKTAVRILNGEMIHKVLVERPKAPGGIAGAPTAGAGAGALAVGGGSGAGSQPASGGTSTPVPGSKY